MRRCYRLLSCLTDTQPHPPPLRRRGELEVAFEVWELLDLRRQDCRFGDMLNAGALGGLRAAEEAATPTLAGVFSRIFALADEL